MSEYYWKRTCTVLVESNSGSVEIGSGLRIQFNCKRSSGKDSNTSELTIWNIRKETASFLESAGNTISITAGYNGNSGVIFRGTISKYRSEYSGADCAHIVQITDGGAQKKVRTSRSWRGPVGSRQIIEDLADEIGLPVEYSASPSKIFKSGYVVAGSSVEALSSVLSSQGMTWVISDQHILITMSDFSAISSSVELSPDTGLIGHPEKAEGADSKQGGWRVKALLLHGAREGGKVVIKSKALNGVFTIRKLEHIGDTDGDDWFTTMEVKQ